LNPISRPSELTIVFTDPIAPAIGSSSSRNGITVAFIGMDTLQPEIRRALTAAIRVFGSEIFLARYTALMPISLKKWL
jgi:hypothetical protein